MRSTPRILAALGSALLIACLGSAGPARAAAFDGQKLDAQGQAVLRQIGDSARDSQLRFPDFQPYQAEFREFYARTGSTLGWVRARKPTPQAIGMIGLFNAAADKGLVPEDYDASRWPARLQALAGTTSDSVSTARCWSTRRTTCTSSMTSTASTGNSMRR